MNQKHPHEFLLLDTFKGERTSYVMKSVIQEATAFSTILNSNPFDRIGI